ncbi:RDD family protein [Paraburkholderia sp. GAS42]|uniref:RDD family protein n=1 Tax=Paraburkholderia sp. GAS42 TaxID=3035135 RepID=UPI003D1D0938
MEPESKPVPETRAPVRSLTTRFEARGFDLTLLLFLLGYPLSYLFTHFTIVLAVSFAEDPIIAQFVVGAFCVFLFFLVHICFDALLYSCFGNTPGKALLSLSVQKNSGEPLSPAEYLQRNLWVWGLGFGYGLPVLWFVAPCLSGRAIQKTGTTRWDTEWGCQVVGVGTRPRASRVVMLFVLYALLMSIAQTEIREAGRSHFATGQTTTG